MTATNSRVKPPVNKEVITTSQELRILQSVQSHLADAQFDLYGTRFSELKKLIDAAIDKTLTEIIGAEDRRNERT